METGVPRPFSRRVTGRLGLPCCRTLNLGCPAPFQSTGASP